MFSCLLSIVTSFAVLLHGLLGCCAHHLHPERAEETGSRGTLAGVHHHSHAGPHLHLSHLCPVHSRETSAEECPPDPCDETECPLIFCLRSHDTALLKWATLPTQPVAVTFASTANTHNIGFSHWNQETRQLLWPHGLPLYAQKMAWLL